MGSSNSSIDRFFQDGVCTLKNTKSGDTTNRIRPGMITATLLNTSWNHWHHYFRYIGLSDTALPPLIITTHPLSFPACSKWLGEEEREVGEGGQAPWAGLCHSLWFTLTPKHTRIHTRHYHKPLPFFFGPTVLEREKENGRERESKTFMHRVKKTKTRNGQRTEQENL